MKLIMRVRLRLGLIAGFVVGIVAGSAVGIVVGSAVGRLRSRTSTHLLELVREVRGYCQIASSTHKQECIVENKAFFKIIIM